MGTIIIFIILVGLGILLFQALWAIILTVAGIALGFYFLRLIVAAIDKGQKKKAKLKQEEQKGLILEAQSDLNERLTDRLQESPTPLPAKKRKSSRKRDLLAETADPWDILDDVDDDEDLPDEFFDPEPLTRAPKHHKSQAPRAAVSEIDDPMIQVRLAEARARELEAQARLAEAQSRAEASRLQAQNRALDAAAARYLSAHQKIDPQERERRQAQYRAAAQALRRQADTLKHPAE